ncbi:MAG: tetratricopeptide repeat protein [Xanthomonadales bacterium]|nr:tetratricopeptide repeat protein [Xanthomonadales bacterium]
MSNRSTPTSTDQGVGLWAELRRRNVIRVAGFYVVSSWLLVQVADVLFPTFEAPGWVMKVLVGLLAAGFVPALIFSWVFELTPEGLKREHEVDRTRNIVDHTARKLDVAVIVLLLVVALLVVWRPAVDVGSVTVGSESTFAEGAPATQPGAAAKVDSDPAIAAAARAPSIAVLAFADLSADKDQEYFADGISEELLNLLARVDGLQVAARTSSFKFKGSQSDIGEIGRALGVDHVLEGSVRKAGNQVRITAQLIKTVDGFHLWSESYDRELDNIFAVQDEIAASIVRQLKLKFDLGTAAAGRTQNPEAYDHYLRGRELARAPTRSGLLRAVEQYEKAVALDPNFAAAYAGIADAWVWLEDYGGVKSSESFPRAEQAAKRALAIDPDSAEAHAAMAFVLDRYHDDSVEAGKAFERTLQLNPNYVTAYNLYADTLYDLGEFERALEVRRRAVALDPLSVFFRSRLANTLNNLGRVDEARTILDQLFQDFPDNDFAHEEIGGIEQAQGNFAAAFRHFRILHDARPGDPFAAAQLARLAAHFGDRALEQAWIGASRARGEDNRWELLARTWTGFAHGDWEALEDVAALHAGYRGAQLRGAIAARRGQWSEARRHLLEAVEQAKAKSGDLNHRLATVPLIDLAWAERELGLDGWQERLTSVHSTLDKYQAFGVVELNLFDEADYNRARLEALMGRRDAALETLRGGSQRVFPEFLQHDPIFAAWRDDPDFLALVADMRVHAAAERAKLGGGSLLP